MRLFFNVFNGNGLTSDEEGLDVEDQATARTIALRSIRSMVAEEAREGMIDLTGRIEIEDAAGNLLLTVAFTEAFQVTLSDETRSQ
jgi:hypothetical protein